jgi:hypothetical protein
VPDLHEEFSMMPKYLRGAPTRLAVAAKNLLILVAAFATTPALLAHATAAASDAQPTQRDTLASQAIATSAELNAVMAGDLNRLRAALADSNAVEPGTKRSLLPSWTTAILRASCSTTKPIILSGQRPTLRH